MAALLGLSLLIVLSCGQVSEGGVRPWMSPEGEGYEDALMTMLQHASELTPLDVGSLQPVSAIKRAMQVVANGHQLLNATGGNLQVAQPQVNASWKCPCIGFSGIQGEISMEIDGTPTVFPGDLGSHCSAWDSGQNPECRNSTLDSPWCNQPWCFVDPCNCDLLDVPKTTKYLDMPDIKFKNMALYYSYETCGVKDHWTTDHNENACVVQMTQAACLRLSKCSWSLRLGCMGSELTGGFCGLVHQNAVEVWGKGNCACIGISGLNGTVDATTDNSTITAYPADIGSTCGAWDEGRHPLCTGATPARFCRQRWCFVDPCTCALKTPPELSTYFPTATFQGHSLYYSYATCRGRDHWTENHKAAACTNQQNRTACGSLGGKCAWVDFRGSEQCLGAEFGAMCWGDQGSGAGRRALPLAAGLLPVLAPLWAGAS